MKEHVKKIIKYERYINFLTITQHSTNMCALRFIPDNMLGLMWQ